MMTIAFVGAATDSVRPKGDELGGGDVGDCHSDGATIDGFVGDDASGELRITRSRSWRAGRPRLEELFLAVNHCVDVVRGQIDAVPVRNRVSGAGLDAIAAKNAARIINIVNAGVALAGGDALRVSILRGFNINAIRGAGRSAEEAAYAFLESVLVALQNVDATIAGLDACGNVRIVFSGRLAKHGFERDAKALHKRQECFANFSYD